MARFVPLSLSLSLSFIDLFLFAHFVWSDDHFNGLWLALEGSTYASFLAF